MNKRNIWTAFIFMFILCSCRIALVKKSRVLNETNGYYFFYNSSTLGPIFFPSDDLQDVNSLNTLNCKDGYFVRQTCSSYNLRYMAKAHLVKLLYPNTKNGNEEVEDSVYIIPVKIKYVTEKYFSNYSNVVEIKEADSLIKMNIHQHYKGVVIDVVAPFLPKAFD